MYNGRVRYAFIREAATLRTGQGVTCTRPKVVVYDFVDIKVLVAKEGYAPSIAPSPFKRHGGLKILLLIKVKTKVIS